MKPLTPDDAIELIRAHLAAREWSPDTLDTINAIVRVTVRPRFRPGDIVRDTRSPAETAEVMTPGRYTQTGETRVLFCNDYGWRIENIATPHLRKEAPRA